MGPFKESKLAGALSAAFGKSDPALVENVSWWADTGVHNFRSPQMPVAQARQVAAQLKKKGIRCSLLCDELNGHTDHGKTVVIVENGMQPYYYATIHKSWHYFDDRGHPTGPAVKSEIKEVKRKSAMPVTNTEHVNKFFAAFPNVKVEGVTETSKGIYSINVVNFMDRWIEPYLPKPSRK